MKIDKTSVLRCPVFVTAQILGKRWTLLILQTLMLPEAEDGLRFNALQRFLHWVSPKILTERLRELESEGLLVRKVDASQSPPHVRYRLTEKGKALRSVLEEIQAWGIKYGQNVVATCLGENFTTCASCTTRYSCD